MFDLLMTDFNFFKVPSSPDWAPLSKYRIIYRSLSEINISGWIICFSWRELIVCEHVFYLYVVNL